MSFVGVSPRESCLAIVGESGSGKTTCRAVSLGLHGTGPARWPWKGWRWDDGAPAQPGALKRVQYIFQDPYTALNPRRTVGQLLAQPVERFFDLPRREVAARVAGALDEVALGAHFMDRYPDELSGGERQRVAIARALASGPELLVCDEVSSALDVSVQATIVELLRSLQQQRHLSMIFVTHNLALARGIAQMVVVLSEGRVVDAGTVDETLARPRSPTPPGPIRRPPSGRTCRK